MHGIINVYKPCGISSNYCLTLLKKQLNIKKVGHLGTLDPLACGVLPVMVNKGTKLFDYYLHKDKVYRAIFTFGKETDTLDSEGVIIKQNSNLPTKTDIENSLSNLVGEIDQIPPIFSAKNVNGERAYNLARQGKAVELKPKKVKIYYIGLIKQIDETSFLFEIKCSSGTYIRSIARDLGNLVNSCAYMSALIRIESGNFNILKSTYIKDLTNINVNDKLIKLEDLFEDKEKINLEKKYFKQISNGVNVSISHENSQNVIVFCDNKLIGIGDILNNNLKIKTNLQT